MNKTLIRLPSYLLIMKKLVLSFNNLNLDGLTEYRLFNSLLKQIDNVYESFYIWVNILIQ